MPRAVRDRLPWRWLALGCLLPDLIDKPIWAVARWMGTGGQSFHSARLVGHSVFFAVAVAIAARIWKTPALAALTWGIPTHLALDILTDWGISGGWGVWKTWLFWPFKIPRLGLLMAALSPLEAIGYEFRAPINLYAEVIGAGLLLWDWRRRRLARSASKRGTTTLQ